MLGILIRKELTETVLDLRFVVATLLFVVLIPLGIYVNCKDYERRLASFTTEHQAYRAQYAKGVWADTEAQGFRPPSVLSIFASGVDSVMPDRVVTSRSGLFQSVENPSLESLHSHLFGRADFLFNVVFVVSLAALIFTFSSVSGEKEAGTLRLMIAHSVPRGQILLTKVLGRTIALVIPFLLSALISLIILATSRFVSLGSSEVWPAFMAILGMTLLFVLGMVSLGICISTMTTRTMSSMVLALFAWMVFVVGIPKVAPMIAESLYPVESGKVLSLARQAAMEDLEKELDHERYELQIICYDEGGVPEKQRYRVPMSKLAEKAADEYARRVVTLEQRYKVRIAEKVRRLEQDNENRRNLQSALAANLSRLSPVSCYTYIVSEISGTGATEPDNFSRNAQRYQDEVKRDIYDRFVAVEQIVNRWYAPVKGFDPEKASVPDMVYHYPTLGEALAEGWPDILLLCLFDVLIFALAFMRFNRYDVR